MTKPVYLQLVESIKNKVHSGDLKPGDAIDSEHTLSKEFGVSRMTVRKGLIMLANQGYIYSVPGKGSYVRKPDYTRFVISYDEMSCVINEADKSELHDVKIIVPDEKLAGSLQISRNKKVILAKRIYYNNGVPIAYDLKYMLYHEGLPVVESEIMNATFPDMVAKGTSPFAIKKELVICAQAPAEEIKLLLGINEDTAVLVVQQKLLNTENKPIGLGITYFRSDYIRLRGINR